MLPLSETEDNEDKRPHAAAFAPEVCVSASGSKITPPEEAPLRWIKLTINLNKCSMYKDSYSE